MTELLEAIHSPGDLKKLSIDQLNSLAGEIRRFMLASVSRNGGHLASNLGAVELTLALHRVFDFQVDKLLWDVGHQCYTHKIITGRKDGFASLRQAGGVSGFPNPGESVYDHFAVGHAGTAIPTAIGTAMAEQIKSGGRPGGEQAGPSPRIVAFVGDASIVNGTSFEGLNNIGLVHRQLLIVLNDNSMAIDATVGAFARYFSQMRLSHTYEDLRRTAVNLMEHVPGIGRSMEEAMERVKKHIRMVVPGSQIFESLNIPYFGPVDGHDIDSLVQLLGALSHVDRPVLLHVYTKKGEGFAPAHEVPSKFHSTGPFVINGDAVEPPSEPNAPSFTDVFGQCVTEMAAKDERIVAITSAMCDGTGLLEFRQRFPARFFDVGIAESAAVDVAAGLAHGGLRPIVCIYSTFLQRSIDQIFQEVALQDLPVVFCVDRAGFTGPDGPTHHGLMDVGFLRMMPNLVLCAPADGGEMRLALEFALQHSHPVVIRYPKEPVPPPAQTAEACKTPFQLGRSVVIGGSPQAELAIVTYGPLLSQAIKAQQILASHDIDVAVINARFVVPMDRAILEWLEKGKKIITLEDHQYACGFASALLELAALSKAGNIRLDAIRCLGAGRSFVRHDTRQRQLIQSRLTADEVVKMASEMLAVPLVV
jgi:1-deoxy-D-xylulose-5-phosphate synthase